MRTPLRGIAGNLAWTREGSVWALYRVAPDPSVGASDRGRMRQWHRARAALACLPDESLVQSLCAGTGARMSFIGARLGAGGAGTAVRAVAGAAGTEVLRTFGLAPPIGRDEIEAFAARAASLLARLEPHLPVRAASSVEAGQVYEHAATRGIERTRAGPLSAEEVWACLREPKDRGYLRLQTEAGLSYQTLLRMSGMPHGQGAEGSWLLDPCGAPFPVDWCLRLRQAGAQGGPGARLEVLVVYAVGSGNLVELAERALTLQHLFAARGCRLDRPAGGQASLLAATLPGEQAWAVLRRGAHVLPAGDLDAACLFAAGASNAPGPGPLDAVAAAERPAGTAGESPKEREEDPAYLVRVVGGPRRGAQVAVAPQAVIGRGAADLDLADHAASSRHAFLQVTEAGVTLGNLVSGSGTWLEGLPIAGTCEIRPGQTFVAGGSELILLEIAPAPQPAPAPAASRFELAVQTPGHPEQRIPLDRRVVVGTGPEADVCVDDPGASARHCEIAESEGTLVVRDLGSAGGTYVCGVPVPAPRILAPGDPVEIGATRIFVAGGPPGAAPPRSPGAETVLELAVRVEGDGHAWSVRVQAAGDASCRDVLEALVDYLGLPRRAGYCLYRERDGLYLAPVLPWSGAHLHRGDLLVVGPLAEGSRGEIFPVSRRRPGHPPPERVSISRAPRSFLPPAALRIALPRVPEEASMRGRGVHWQLAAGFGMGVTALIAGIAFPAHRWIALAGALTSVFGIGASLMAERSRRRAEVKRFLRRLGELDGVLGAAVAAQRAALDGAQPPAATVGAWVASRGERLWERRRTDPDFLALRLGRGGRPALLELHRPDPDARGALAERLGALLETYGTIDPAPVGLPGLAASVVGIAGPRDSVDGLARSLLVQAAGLHPPRDLRIAVVATSRAWAWARWLPHARVEPSGARVSSDPDGADALAASLARLLAPREAEGLSSRGRAEEAEGLPMLVLVDRAAGGRPAMAALLGTDLAGRAQILVLGDDRRSLPSGIDSVVEVGPECGVLLGAGAERGPQPFAPEGLTEEEAAGTARALAPLFEPGAGSGGGLRAAGLLDLLGVDGTVSIDVEALWYGNPGRETLTTPVGVTDAGEVLTLGFRRDGPHGLVAGTTASGKSELLQTILAGLALTHPPELVGFVLVDYKGGAAFSDIARLPHAVGLVTDLDGQLAARALISLNSELKRRETILREADVPNITEYERLGAARSHPLPNLIIVVDELATLAQELPGFVDSLVDVAQRGRSLGVHLLLATQSPAGVVSPKIQANTNMWVCLRVTLGSESQTMIGSADAALIPVNAPGRGFLRVGAGLTAFQTARIAGPATQARRAAGPAVKVSPFLDVRPVPAAADPAPAAGRPSGTRTITELQLATERVAAEAERLGISRRPGPWMPPLPARLDREGAYRGGALDRSRLTVLLGLQDEPELQRQSPVRLDLSADGACVVLGAFGAGKTTLLRQVALDLASTYGADEVHVYGIDAGDGSLGPLTALPHCADAVGVDDLDRTIRAIGRLARLAEERRTHLAGAGAGDWVRFRAARPAGAPWIVLLIDDYPAFAEISEGHRHGVLTEQLTSLVRTGPQVGIHAILASQQRSDMSGAMFGLFGRRILMRQSDRADYDLVELRRDLVPSSPPPGRGFVSGAIARELQVVWPMGAGEEYPPVDLASDLAAATRHLPAGSCPKPVPRFPSEVPLARLLASTPPGRGTLAVGVGGAELEPVLVDLERTCPHLLVGGRDRSGRSAALRTCVESIVAADPSARFTILAPRPSPLRELAGDGRVDSVAVTTRQIQDALAALPMAKGRAVLVADDCEALPQEVSPGLNALLRAAWDAGLKGIFAGRTSDLLRMYDDWMRYLRSLQSGILLTPEPPDGDLFEIRLPAVPMPRLPGRGYLVQGGTLVTVQVALPKA